jgi:hypothetical protein
MEVWKERLVCCKIQPQFLQFTKTLLIFKIEDDNINLPKRFGNWTHEHRQERRHTG